MEDQGSSTRRVVAGGLFALFCALVIAALAVFGIISMTLGHIFMAAACLVGALLIWTEVIPSKPAKHKLIWTLLLWVLMGGADFWIVKHKETEVSDAAKSIPAGHPAESTPPHPVASPARQTSPDTVPKKYHLTPTDDPVGHLSKLGWNVKREKNQLLQFEVAYSPLPNMDESEAYFKNINEPFRLHFQGVQSISGLEKLSKIAKCQEIGIYASDLSGISELAGFVALKRLEIGQVPINTRANIDSSPLLGLVNLERLSLSSSRFSDLTPAGKMPNLRELVIENTLIRDLSPLSALHGLIKVDVRNSKVSALSPLAQSPNIKELTIDGMQVAALGPLSSMSITKVTLIESGPVNLAPLGMLSRIENLTILGPAILDMAFLTNIHNLRSLQIMGFGGAGSSQVANLGSICASGKLTTLAMSEVQVQDLKFVSGCRKLTEISLNNMPITSIEELADIPTLKKISLGNVPVVEISPLLELPNLESLSVIGVPARADVLAALERKGVKVTNP